SGDWQPCWPVRPVLLLYPLSYGAAAKGFLQQDRANWPARLPITRFKTANLVSSQAANAADESKAAPLACDFSGRLPVTISRSIIATRTVVACCDASRTSHVGFKPTCALIVPISGKFECV